MLAGAAADLEHVPAFSEMALQHRQDRLAVALAGGREGFRGVVRGVGDHRLLIAAPPPARAAPRP
jgi:hypothetical protein